MTAYIVLAAIPVALWAGLEAIARRDRHRRRAAARARRRAGFVDMTPPPAGPFDHDTLDVLLGTPMEDIEQLPSGWADTAEWRYAAEHEPERSRRSPWHPAA
jgi:hypothetical protein